jgi:hypothetical protein
LIDPNSIPAFDRLKKTAFMVEQAIQEHFKNKYGLEVTYENMEQVYHPRVSGLQTLAETRDHLIECGMSDYWADKLMRLYLSKIEKESYLCTVLACFTRPEAKGYLNKASPTDIYSNYVNLHNTSS